jgi:hydroxymethylbilane synthase
LSTNTQEPAAIAGVLDASNVASSPTVPRLGTRGSALALVQTRIVQNLLSDAAPSIQTVVHIVHSLGDRVRDRPLAALNAQGIFTQAIEEALRNGEVDAAVHSAKDLPSTLPPDMCIAAVPQRADPRDCLVTRDGLSLATLPRGATVGTGSPRRVAQLRRLRPDLQFHSIRGNVDTRRGAALEGRFDAVILAAAGLDRLGLLDSHAYPLSADECLPQAGQGALALEIRLDDEVTSSILARINHAPSAACLDAERAVLARLNAGCQAPVAAYATVENGRICLSACVASLDGSIVIEATLTGPLNQATELGAELAEELRSQGADALLAKARGHDR